jgi:hypothetical protein
MSYGSCSYSTPPALGSVVHASGTFGKHRVQTYVVDDSSGEVVAGYNTYAWIPGLAPGAPPRSYTVVVELSHVEDLQTSSFGDAYDEVTLGSTTYTGTYPDPSKMIIVCGGTVETRYIDGSFVDFCLNPTRYDYITALDDAQLSLTYVGAVFTGLAEDQVTWPAYAPGSSFDATLNWDAGNDDLPGAN